jgi:ABC-type Fe3+-hydroxamate transport system substrate-binding protein
MRGPEVIVLALCGFDVDRARRDYELLRKFPGFDSLPAAQNNRIHIVDASAYFARPGPALWRFSPALCILKNFRSSVRVGLITS